jgi:hypothetical protein
MIVHDVEYQYDRHKLTIYYSTEMRIDFREFVKDLFSMYRTRIWMKKIYPIGPFMQLPKTLRYENWASVALATGMKFTPEK